MIELKKNELVSVLLTIAAYDKDSKLIGGLLTEKVTLGLKRRLQKIHTETMPHYTEFEKDLAEVEKIEDEVQKKKEMDELLNEVIKLNSEKASLELIDSISSENVYDSVLIEKIAE